MKIELNKLFTGNVYFEIILNESVYSTNEDISEALNLSIDTYSKLLIEKVIQHKIYYANPNTKDLLFSLNRVPKEIYLERFKSVFNKELTLLALGGEMLNEN